VNPLATLCAMALGAVPLAAAECRLALVLAMDVSSSVDEAEDALQRGGLASALISAQVEAAVFASPLPVAIAVYEWSGRYHQERLVDWTLLHASEDLRAVAETVALSKRRYSEFPTALGHALEYAADLFERGPNCTECVLDIAGDGENNEGFSPGTAYAQFPFDGITVNGLVIEVSDYRAEITVAEYYEKNVLYGPGAFLEVARGFTDYERAIRRKLEREISPRAVGSTLPDSVVGPG